MKFHNSKFKIQLTILLPSNIFKDIQLRLDGFQLGFCLV